jgi:hypothetical protein
MIRNNVDAATSSSNLDLYECDTDEEIEKIKMEEMKEKKKKQESTISKESNDPFECDTDEEIEQTKKEKSVKGKLSHSAYECDTDEETPEKDVDPYDVDTDIDEEEIVKLLPSTSNLSLGNLPDYFDCHQFYLHGDFQ